MGLKTRYATFPARALGAPKLMQSPAPILVLIALATAFVVVPLPIGKDIASPVAFPQSHVLQRLNLSLLYGTNADKFIRRAQRAVLKRGGLAPDANAAETKSPSLFCRANLIWFGILAYSVAFVLLATSHRAQTYLIYLHWIRPPEFLIPLKRLERHRLASSGRVVSQGNLCGWHILPPGPPFTDGTDDDFDFQIGQPRQRVILFFHGNSGHRAFPGKRVDMIRLLGAQFQAHVVTFDYSGFGDSGGRPDEKQFYLDAKNIFEWVRQRVARDSDIIIYGQSLGTFAAVDLAAHLCEGMSHFDASECAARLVILDAPPASLIDASMTHPVARPFRVVPYCEAFFRSVLKEKHDSVAKVPRIKIPLLIMHGQEDSMVTVEQGEKLYNAARKGANPSVEFIRFPNCGHVNINACSTYLRATHKFLERHLTVPLKNRF